MPRFMRRPRNDVPREECLRGALARAEQTWENVQAIVKIAPELPVPHHLFQIPMSSRNHANIPF
jgi:hypothetical protein